jgi:hypothetical protein
MKVATVKAEIVRKLGDFIVVPVVVGFHVYADMLTAIIDKH